MTAGMGTPDGIHGAIARICAWMVTHDAPLLAENLADGASPEAIARAEAQLGGPLPDDLRQLWLLHDGQNEWGNGFVESYDLLSIAQALDERSTLHAGLTFAQANASWWARSGGTDEELASDHWIPFAGRDSDLLAVHGVSGRVFACRHDDNFKVIADSFAAWLDAYVARVEADDYVVEAGFGDYFLETRNREAEARQAERAAQAAAKAEMRRTTPLRQQLRSALAAHDEGRCTEVVGDAIISGDAGMTGAILDLLFAEADDSQFLAATLRTLLNKVTLTAERWDTIAAGGEALGNNAIRNLARARAAEARAGR
jgi:cell wall assembly regulator SMI1